MLKCFCNCDNFTTLIARDYLYRGLNTFKYGICNNCESYYLINDGIITNNYNSNYYSIINKVQKNSNILRTLRFTSSSFFSKFLRKIKPLSVYDSLVSEFIKKNNPNVLDFGSGTSSYINFLKSINVLKNLGYSYDPYSKDSDTITDFKNIPFNKINLIISNQAFEHLPDLKLKIDELFELTGDNCELIFSVPVVGTVLKTFQQYSYTLQAPDHISILSIHSWIKLLSDTKWKIVAIYNDFPSQKSYDKKSNLLKIKYNPDFKIKRLKESISDNMIFHLKK